MSEKALKPGILVLSLDGNPPTRTDRMPLTARQLKERLLLLRARDSRTE